MKKIFLLISAIIFSINLSFAQWKQEGTSHNYYLLNGLVGIGTSAPTSLLHIVGNAIQISSVLQNTATGTVYSNYLAYDGNGINAFFGTQGGVSGAVGTTSNHPMQFFTNNYSRMTIEVSGNVGIGTTSPAHKLDVQGGDINTSGGLAIGDNSTGSTNRLYFAGGNLNHYIYSSGSGGNSMYFGEYLSGSGTGFHWTNTNGGAEVMTINSLGYLGIGTKSPDQLLTVNGTIHAKQVNIDLGAFPHQITFSKRAIS